MFLSNYISIKGQKLNEYQYSTGGGMTGAFYREKIKRDGDKAVINIQKAEFHNEEPVKNEYIVDLSVLDEIEAVVRKYRMNFWHRKKFTNMFVSDGESESFSFGFDKNSVSFSSQIYPERYGIKLRELKAIVQKYMPN